MPCVHSPGPWMFELRQGGCNTLADYCLVYNYFSTWTAPSTCPDPSTVPTTGTGNNGIVMGYWYNDSVNTTFNHTANYTYDNVNRLTQATATGNSTYNQIYAYGYPYGDGSNGQYGNMVCTTGCTPANWTLNPGNNQLIPSTSYTYDAAGNLTKDSSNPTVHTYQWDAEGRVSSVDNGATWGFTYNALGHRVQWTYSNGAGADQHMFDPNGGWLGIYGALDVLRRGDGAYAWYTGTEMYFNHVNNIGTTAMLTNHFGTEVYDLVYYPWGQMPAWLSSGGGGANYAELPYQNVNTNTNIAMYRFHSPGLGRWHSPDPLGGDITNPQSLNRYAYVLNNPTTLIDPLGLSEQSSQSNEGEYDPCSDPNYTSAECGGPGWPPGFWPPPIWGEPGGAGPTVSLPTGNPDTGLGDEFLGNGCIDPSIFTRLFIFGGTWAAKILGAGGTGQTKSVTFGVGESAGAGTSVGLGPSFSTSLYDQVDANGNAAQVSTYTFSPVNPVLGSGVVAGVQLGTSNSTVPKTPQSSVGWGSNSTIISAGGGNGLGGQVDIAKSGITVTSGVGLGGKGASNVLFPVYVITGSTPYCRKSKIW